MPRNDGRDSGTESNPSSNVKRYFARRIHNSVEDMKDQSIAQVKSSKYSSLQIDESIDIANKVIFTVFVRY